MSDRADQLGRLMAAILAGSWRPLPPALEMSAPALDDVTLGLLRSKTGALAWWRVRNSSLRDSPAGERLLQAYRNHAFQTALHARNLVQIVTRLRTGGVEPVLVKGPAIARLYAERGLRPFGDLDLCVRADQHRDAAALLDGWGDAFSPVDLHSGFAELRARTWDDAYARSQLATFGGTEVRVLAPEDHLRFLCLHQLRHGAPTPLWLCDVAVLLEKRPPAFDWDLVLGPDRRTADWVACTIGLAHQLLGVSVDDTPAAARARRLPEWLVSSVLDGWGRQCAADYEAPALSPRTWDLMTHFPTAVRQYWPSPVAASIHLRRPFSDFPRLPIQVVDAVARLVRFSVRRLFGLRPDLDQL
jgi:hypothetical protein